MSMIGCFAIVSAQKLEELRADPDTIFGYLHPDGGMSDPPDYLEIGKAWDGIHYLLTGTSEGGAEPLGLAVFGGEEFGDEVGYGPARFLLPAQVRAVSEALAGLDAEELTRRFDPADMDAQGIYPRFWSRDGDDALDYLLEEYGRLADFYRQAASRGDAVLQWVT